MFTGIIETVGKVAGLRKNATNLEIEIASDISDELKIDQSVSHNGVCLTVVKTEKGHHRVTAVDETLKKSNMGALKEGDHVNLERCMKADGRFDGHMVQGHVDTTATVCSISDRGGSRVFDFEMEPTDLIVEKGSICINGTSLTCFDVKEDKCSIAVIPYTFEHTNFNRLQVGDEVNIEYDIIGKYIRKTLSRS